MSRKLPTFTEIQGRVLKNSQLAALNPHLLTRQNAQKAAFLTSETPGTVNVPDQGVKGKKRREMNLTEKSFSYLLDNQVDTGKILGWEYESIMFRWGEKDTLKYSPDFTVFVADHRAGEEYPFVKLRFIETFGAFKRPGDLRRFKEARNRFTLFEFQLWSKTKEEGWKQLL